jgi:hypothetical protein
MRAGYASHPVEEAVGFSLASNNRTLTTLLREKSLADYGRAAVSAAGPRWPITPTSVLFIGVRREPF